MPIIENVEDFPPIIENVEDFPPKFLFIDEKYQLYESHED